VCTDDLVGIVVLRNDHAGGSGTRGLTRCCRAIAERGGG
jgi:hypothetical protein